jgi:hypothetical protein
VFIFDIENWLWAIGRLLVLDGTSPFERIATSARNGGELLIEGPTNRLAQWRTGNAPLYVERRRYQRAEPTGATLATYCETPSLRASSISRRDVRFLYTRALQHDPRGNRREAST